MKKIISYSLWGEDTRYTDGAIRNVELAQNLYKDWICRFHIGNSTPVKVIEILNSFNNTELILRTEECNWKGMFWRFEDASDPDVDIMICRDVDSRPTTREVLAVNQWLESDKDFHIMRDHPYHATEILGGMWGVKNPFLEHMKSHIDEYSKGDFWQVDQNFLREKIYPLVRGNVFVHDEFFGSHYGEPTFSYSYPRDANHFIGQAYAGNDKILDAEEYFIDVYDSQDEKK
jgi:hypothetical protein